MNYFLRSSAVTGERQGSSWKALRVKGEIFSFFKIGDTRALCTLLEGEVDATEEMRASQQRSWRKQVCQQNSWPLPRAGTCVLGTHQDEILLSCLGIMSVWKRMEGDIRMSPVVISRGYSYRWFIFLYFFWYSGFFFKSKNILYTCKNECDKDNRTLFLTLHAFIPQKVRLHATHQLCLFSFFSGIYLLTFIWLCQVLVAALELLVAACRT